MKRRLGHEPDDEVWNVIVCRAVVKVGDRESEAGVLHKSIHMLVGVNEVRSLSIIIRKSPTFIIETPHGEFSIGSGTS